MHSGVYLMCACGGRSGSTASQRLQLLQHGPVALGVAGAGTGVTGPPGL